MRLAQSLASPSWTHLTKDTANIVTRNYESFQFPRWILACEKKDNNSRERARIPHEDIDGYTNRRYLVLLEYTKHQIPEIKVPWDMVIEQPRLANTCQSSAASHLDQSSSSMYCTEATKYMLNTDRSDLSCIDDLPCRTLHFNTSGYVTAKECREVLHWARWKLFAATFLAVTCPLNHGWSSTPSSLY